MPASWKKFDLRRRNQPGQFLGKVGRRDDIVLGPDDQGRGLDARQLVRSVERQHRINPARDDLNWREVRQVLRLQLAKAFVVPGDPPARGPVKRGRLYTS